MSKIDSKECIRFLESERDKYYAIKISRMSYNTKQEYNDVINTLKLLEKINREYREVNHVDK